ncbi:hypothetical protein BC828DRAFT_349486 [Blastocladiella britannica]|nr:hypothetical protein BC828DRAFT_349486 [Blastocladiella britannica]
MQAFSSVSSTDRGVDDLIRLDHKSLWELHDRYLAMAGNDDAQTAVANELIREIVQHSSAEELTVYAAIEEHEGKEVADKLRSDHQTVRNQLYQLQSMRTTSPQHASLLSQVMTELRSHAREEEESDLPMLRAKIGDANMVTLGHKFSGAKKMAPTNPHPSAPIKPIAEAIAGMFTKPIDKVADLGKDFAGRAVPEE